MRVVAFTVNSFLGRKRKVYRLLADSAFVRNDDSAGSLDMAIMVWVFHMLDKPTELLTGLRPSLKPGASLVILDPHDDEIDTVFGIDRSKPDVKVPAIKERIERSAEESSFELVRVETFLRKDTIFILCLKD